MNNENNLVQHWYTTGLIPYDSEEVRRVLLGSTNVTADNDVILCAYILGNIRMYYSDVCGDNFSVADICTYCMLLAQEHSIYLPQVIVSAYLSKNKSVHALPKWTPFDINGKTCTSANDFVYICGDMYRPKEIVEYLGIDLTGMFKTVWLYFIDAVFGDVNNLDVMRIVSDERDVSNNTVLVRSLLFSSKWLFQISSEDDARNLTKLYAGRLKYNEMIVNKGDSRSEAHMLLNQFCDNNDVSGMSASEIITAVSKWLRSTTVNQNLLEDWIKDAAKKISDIPTRLESSDKVAVDVYRLLHSFNKDLPTVLCNQLSPVALSMVYVYYSVLGKTFTEYSNMLRLEMLNISDMDTLSRCYDLNSFIKTVDGAFTKFLSRLTVPISRELVDTGLVVYIYIWGHYKEKGGK